MERTTQRTDELSRYSDAEIARGLDRLGQDLKAHAPDDARALIAELVDEVEDWGTVQRDQSGEFGPTTVVGRMRALVNNEGATR